MIAADRKFIGLLFEELKKQASVYSDLRQEYARLKIEAEFRRKMMALLGEGIELAESGQRQAKGRRQ